MSQPKLYYIQNLRAGYVGNSVLFWGHDSKGYTCNAEDAGVYTEEEAHRICGNRPTVDRMLLKSAVDKHWRRHFDAQDLHLVLHAEDELSTDDDPQG